MRRPRPALRLASTLLLLAALVILAPGATGCGGGGGSFLTITATPNQVPADGKSTVRISIQAVFEKQAVTDGTEVDLSVTSGSFDPTDPTVKTDALSTTGGTATATWYPPQKLGSYPITGSFTDEATETHKAEATVQVVNPPPVDGASFTFTCPVKNIGVPSVGSDPVVVPCELNAKDINGNPVLINANRFGFMAEAGTLSIDPNTGGVIWTIKPGDQPADVDPAGGITTGEPRWTENGGGVTHNPRDGIATLVVYTRGKPDGPYDALRGEPFVDENDNGTWDPGEPYYDANKDGSYTGPTSAGVTEIWRFVKVLMTGDVDPQAEVAANLPLWTTPSAHGTSGGSKEVDIKPGQSATIGVTLLDKNLNPVAALAMDGSDNIQITVGNADATVTPSQVPIPEDFSGLSFDPASGKLNGMTARQTYLQNKDLQFVITNGIDPTNKADETWSIGAVDISRMPDPSGSTISGQLPPSGSGPTAAPQGILCWSAVKCPCPAGTKGC